MNPWQYIHALLGPGLLWHRPQIEFFKAIAAAEEAGQHEAAEHLRIMLANRNVVMFEDVIPSQEV